MAGPAKATPALHRATRSFSLDGWQVVGIVLILVILSPALITGTDRDWAEGLSAVLMSSPLLTWLLAPSPRSDDLFDETARRRAERIDCLAIVLLWTWPLTCGALPGAARWVQLVLLRW